MSEPVAQPAIPQASRTLNLIPVGSVCPRNALHFLAAHPMPMCALS
jgi:hypothetical protein